MDVNPIIANVNVNVNLILKQNAAAHNYTIDSKMPVMNLKDILQFNHYLSLDIAERLHSALANTEIFTSQNVI